MPIIELETIIRAPVERCFDLARSIDLHRLSVSQTQEEAIAGVTSGLIGPDEEVTWRARHFGVVQTLSVRITQYDRPRHFRDSLVAGAFRRLEHDHFFEAITEGCRMRDRFDYSSPFGILGTLADRVFLERYMRRLLIRRNEVIRRVAESDEWRALLPDRA